MPTVPSIEQAKQGIPNPYEAEFTQVNSASYQTWKTEHEESNVDCSRVMKLDCIGHVQKRMGTALRELKRERWMMENQFVEEATGFRTRPLASSKNIMVRLSEEQSTEMQYQPMLQMRV